MGETKQDHLLTAAKKCGGGVFSILSTTFEMGIEQYGCVLDVRAHALPSSVVSPPILVSALLQRRGLRLT